MDELQLQALRAEIAAKVDAEVIATRDTALIAAALSKDRVRMVLVPIADLQAYLQKANLWWVIKAAAANTIATAHNAAVVVLDVANARYENVDLTLPFVVEQLDQLVASGLMTAEQLADLQAMATRPAPITELEMRAICRSPTGEWLL